jgi:predicted dehydrogenase
MQLPAPVPDIVQKPLMPREKHPIVSIGAGGIVRDAHLPAYARGGFDVAGIFDVNAAKARELAAQFQVLHVYETLDKAIEHAPAGAIFDVAVPANAVLDVVGRLPDGAAVLIQKPLGEDLEGARAIRDLCRAKDLKAAVNFQLRYAPYVLGARSLLESGSLGDLVNLEVRVSVDMPWHLWTFLEGLPRMEIIYHSVHYVDLVRSFLGEPEGVWARTVKHPRNENLASTRTEIILDYGERRLAHISTNHNHVFGPRHQESYVSWEGTRGAVKATLGLLMDYPKGRPDALEWCVLDQNGSPGEWRSVTLEGSWYPDAFIGTMGSLMRWVEGSDGPPPTHVEDAYRTMAVVEAAYRSSAAGGTVIPD